MPLAGLRPLVLAGLLFGTAALTSVVPGPSPSVARWPTDDALFAADGWVVGDAEVNQDHGEYFVSRRYARADGAQLVLSIATDTNAKNVYRAGADVPFLGGGYVTEPAPPELTPTLAGQSAFVASQGEERWLVEYAFGERRGLLGNGPLGWTAAIVDGVTGTPNDYYLLRVMLPLPAGAQVDGRAAVRVAETVLPRLSSWYGTS